MQQRSWKVSLKNKNSSEYEGSTDEIYGFDEAVKRYDYLKSLYESKEIKVVLMEKRYEEFELDI